MFVRLKLDFLLRSIQPLPEDDGDGRKDATAAPRQPLPACLEIGGL